MAKSKIAKIEKTSEADGFKQDLADQIFAQFKDSEHYKTSKGTPEHGQLLFAYCARELNQMVSEIEHLATTALKNDLLSSEE